MSDYPMLISNKLHSFRNFQMPFPIFEIGRIPTGHNYLSDKDQKQCDYTNFSSHIQKTIFLFFKRIGEKVRFHMSLLYENFHLLHDIGVLFRHIAIFMNIVFKIEKLHRSLGILTKI